MGLESNFHYGRRLVFADFLRIFMSRLKKSFNFLS